VKTDTLRQILESIEGKRALVLATDLETGEQRLLREGDGRDLEERTNVQDALRLDNAITTDSTAGPRTFYQPFNPPLRMIMVGAVHVAQPLSMMAALVGYEVTIVDPRSAFAATERFPNVGLDLRWPDQALQALALDRRSAVVTLTHDPKLDDPALRVALRSDAFFIGCLGSAKTHAARLQRLAKAGFSKTDLCRLHGPVGLPIGSRSPAEIAVSILAQIVQTLRKPAL
jgi:xanthine dehydrogenase accessory factor